MLTVSVIIPCYNARHTIGRALRSVCDQSHLPLEVIVVNDASTDGSEETIELLREHLGDVALRLINLGTNQGAAVARNKGWDLAKGDLIAFLDADDSWHPRKIELQTTWMAANPSIKICGHAYTVQDRSEEKISFVSDLTFGNIRLWAFEDFLIRNRLSTPTVMLSRSLTQRFPTEKRYCEDYDLWLQISHTNGPCAWSETALTVLHKQAWGITGLSSDLLPMYQAEKDCYEDCFRKGWISWSHKIALKSLSTIKLVRRLLQKQFGQRQ